MVTKRARRWFARGTLIATLLTVGVLAASTWSLAGTIVADLVDLPAGEGSTLVVDIGAREVVLERTDRAAAAGRWGLVGEGGFADLGPVVGGDETTVVRRVLRREGDLVPGSVATVSRVAFGSDPGAVGAVFEDVLIAVGGEDRPAWTIPGSDDTWIVYVGDGGFDRSESLRIVPVAARLALPMLVLGEPIPVDDTVPADGTDTTATSTVVPSDLGSDRWRDVEAAIRYAVASGAVDVVLIGSGTGGSAVLLAARQSRLASRVTAMVLDGALLDPGVVADRRLERDKTPGFLIGWAKAAATFRRGIDWTALDHLRLAEEQTLPVLLFHGDQGRYPVESARRYAVLAPGARLVEVAGAGHGESWNVDPGRYDRELEAFLREVAVGSRSEAEATD